MASNIQLAPHLTTIFTTQTLLLIAPLIILMTITLTLRQHNRSHPHPPIVLSTNSAPSHSFSKVPQPSITLVRNLGVEQDCHNGATVQHLSRMKVDDPPPNLRQVHLLHHEILQELDVQPAEIGENITTRNIDLLGLGKGTILRFVKPNMAQDLEALQQAPQVMITGLRNPCWQIDNFRKGLQERFVERDENGKIVARKAGVMSTVERGGAVEPGMIVVVERPSAGFEALDVV